MLEYITEEQLEIMIQNGLAIELQTRDEVRKEIDRCDNKGVSFSLFSLMYEDGFYYLNGIRWVNCIGYVFVEGNYLLKD